MTMALNTVKAFARVHVDRAEPAAVAEELGVTPLELDRLIESEHRRRERSGTLPLHMRAGRPTRGWALTRTEPAVCDDHGPFIRDVFELQPAPVAAGNMGLSRWLEPRKTHCPHCDRIMQVEVDARDKEIRQGKLRDDFAIRMALERAGVPVRMHGCTWMNWSHPTDAHKRAYNFVRSYADDLMHNLEIGRSAAFTGTTGTGKTHLAVGLLRHVLGKGGTGRYTTLSNMLGRIKATFSKDGPEKEHDVIRDLTRCDLLVIDEIGRGTESNYETSQLFRVLDERYMNQRPTLLVSNLSPAGLKQQLGDAALDRLRHNGGSILNFDWGSHRSPKKPSTKQGDDE
jgi:DNA replication protein DnaC